MRNAFKLILAFLLVTSFVMAQGPSKYRPISWNGGSATATLVAAGIDTSDVFILYNDFKMNGHSSKRAPSTLAWMVFGTESGATDSTNVTFYLDLGNTRTGPWIADTIGQTLASDATAATVTGLKMTDNVFTLYGRVRADGAQASGDTVVVGAQLHKIFND